MHARALPLAALKGAAARAIVRARGRNAGGRYDGAGRNGAAGRGDLRRRRARDRPVACGSDPLGCSDPRERTSSLSRSSVRSCSGSCSKRPAPSQVAHGQNQVVERGRRLAWIVALDEAYREWEADVIGPVEVTRRLREMDARLVPVRSRRARARLAWRSRRGGPAARRGHRSHPARSHRRRAVDQPERGAGGRAPRSWRGCSPVRWSGMSSARGATTPCTWWPASRASATGHRRRAERCARTR